MRYQNLATRDQVQEHRYFDPDDDFLGIQNLLAFHPYRVRELVSDDDKIDGGVDFRVQKDRLSRGGGGGEEGTRGMEEEAGADDDRAKVESDDFGLFAAATQAIHDAGKEWLLACSALSSIFSCTRHIPPRFCSWPSSRKNCGISTQKNAFRCHFECSGCASRRAARHTPSYT
jgi:hypothetical protein